MQMKSVTALIKTLRPILKRRGVVSAGLFGSAARGEAGPDSDVDLLVEYAAGVDLFDVIDLKDELEKALGRRVDLTSPKRLKPRLRDRILREQIVLL